MEFYSKKDTVLEFSENHPIVGGTMNLLRAINNQIGVVHGKSAMIDLEPRHNGAGAFFETKHSKTGERSRCASTQRCLTTNSSLCLSVSLSQSSSNSKCSRCSSRKLATLPALRLWVWTS